MSFRPVCSKFDSHANAGIARRTEVARSAVSAHRRGRRRARRAARSRDTSASIRPRRACTSAVCSSIMLLVRLQRARASAGRARRRRHRADRRSGGQGVRASARRRRRRSATNTAAIGKQLERFLDFTGPNAARMINNAEWLVDAARGRLHARRRQALHRELHAAEGLGEGAHGGRDLVHRVLVHAAPGVRLSRAAPAPRRSAADGRQRSVGEHHGRHRADSPHARRSTRTRSRRRSSRRRPERSSARRRRARSGSTRRSRRRTSSINSSSTSTTATPGRYLRYFTLLDRRTTIEALERRVAEQPGEARGAARARRATSRRACTASARLAAAEEVSELLFGGARSDGAVARRAGRAAARDSGLHASSSTRPSSRRTTCSRRRASAPTRCSRARATCGGWSSRAAST